MVSSPPGAEIGQQIGDHPGVLGGPGDQPDGMLVASVVDRQRHHAQMLGEPDPVDHQRRDIQLRQVRRQQPLEGATGRGHEPARHCRLRRPRRGPVELAAHRFEPVPVAAGRRAGQHPFQRHLAEHVGGREHLIGSRRQLG